MNHPRGLMFPVLATVCLAFAGCTDADWENAMSYLPLERGQKTTQEAAQADVAAPPAPAIQSVAPPPALASMANASDPRAINEHCRVVAAQRASDGQYMGMDEDAQRDEYERTYADCAAWDAAHRY
jgi:hypothetical protein